MGDLEPRMRAGDADRAKVVEQLGRHLGEGRLTVAEFDERVGQAHAAVYLDELPPLLADLPPEPAPAPVPARRPPRSADWAARGAIAVMVGMLLAWSVVGLVHGVPPVFALVLLFVLLRHRQWRRRW